MKTHETVASYRKVHLGSDRKFGLTFAVIFAVFGAVPVFRHESPRWALLAISAAFFAAAVLRPGWLTPLNRAWFKLGLLLNKIVSPIVMGFLFFGVVTPFAWFLRGKDLLSLKLKPEAETYWIDREPPGPARGSLTKQF
jgi:hypothetical protein